MSVKHDQGKPRPSLVLGSMSRALNAVIEVAEHGAAKYEVDGWTRVPNGQQRYTDATLRHLLADVGGEARDPDSGLLHAAQVAWGALARLELELRAGGDDAKLDPAAQVRGHKLAVDFDTGTRAFYFASSTDQDCASRIVEERGLPQTVSVGAVELPEGAVITPVHRFAGVVDFLDPPSVNTMKDREYSTVDGIAQFD